MKSYRAIIVCLVSCCLLCCFWACDEQTATPREDWNYDSFPLEVGTEWHYSMDSITLRQQVGGVAYDSVRLDVLETLRDTLRDLEGNLWYRGERYDRRLDNESWRFRQTFLLRKDERQAYRLEDNLSFVKLVFPFKNNTWWDGHVAFDEYRLVEIAGQPMSVFANWNYRFLSIQETEVIGNTTFDEVVTIEGADFENLLNRRLSIEKYAEGIGLVYREMEVFDTQCIDCCNGDTGACLSLPWREKAESGFILRQWLVE